VTAEVTVGDATVLAHEEFAAVLEGVRRVGAEAARRADELDQLGVIPVDLFDELVATGCLQAMLPRAYGGLELSLPQINELTIEASRANGSLGWILLIGIPGPLVLGMFSKETAEKLLNEFPNARGRGAIAPKGRAVPTEGGYLVSGQWPFASGGPNPDFVVANCVVFEDGAPRIGSDGVPDMVLAMVRASEVEFLDTWHVLGLRGTDSRDFALRDVFVPEHMTVNMFTATNCFDTPATRLPLRVPLAFAHAALAIGIAQGALDDIAELALTKRAAMNPTMLLAADPVFRHALGEQALRLASARALLDQVTERAWQAGLTSRPLTPREILEGRTMAGYITAECVKIVDAAYTMAGSVSLYDGSSLQRRLRDIHVATQHIAATSEAYRTLGAILVGEELSPLELF
jgi:alkylation response protein AidB-like acyl-CoA dehydrogenase